MNSKTHTTNLRILAADIGGTQARFAEARVDGAASGEPAVEPSLELGSVFTMETRQEGVNSFVGFCNAFRKKAPPELADMDAFDAVALALAGAVGPDSAVLPNIDWDITRQDARAFPNLFLLNDFVAQGYALAAPDAFSRMELIRRGDENLPGALAMVGAGTGLGHCALLPDQQVLGSEAGHTNFSFEGDAERDIEQEGLKRSGKRWFSNDDIVSGSGAVHLHAALTGQLVTAAEALGGAHPQTVEWFSRFYGRACRNYCLTIFPVRGLVVSGGIAARHPHLVRSDAFLASFNDAADYSELMSRIPIWLNTDPHIGIRGAALSAANKMGSDPFSPFPPMENRRNVNR